MLSFLCDFVVYPIAIIYWQNNYRNFTRNTHKTQKNLLRMSASWRSHLSICNLVKRNINITSINNRNNIFFLCVYLSLFFYLIKTIYDCLSHFHSFNFLLQFSFRLHFINQSFVCRVFAPRLYTMMMMMLFHFYLLRKNQKKKWSKIKLKTKDQLSGWRKIDEKKRIKHHKS